MIRQKIAIVPLFFAFCISAFAQQRRELKGEVFIVGENGEKIPQAKLIVTLKETGNSDDTNDHGLYFIALPDYYKPGEKTTLVIDKLGWRVRYPLDGEVSIPYNLEKEIVEIELLPVGSKLFWTNDRIEKVIKDIAGKSKEQINPIAQPKEIDFSRYIKDWATQYGFSAEEAKEQIDKWVAEIEEKQDDFYKLGLAAFAKKKFDKAGEYFTESAEQKAKLLQKTEKQQQALEEKKRKLTEDVVRDYTLAGNAHLNNQRFDEALNAYQHAMSFVVQQETPKHSAELSLAIGITNLGWVTNPQSPKRREHFSNAITALRRAASIYSPERDPDQWGILFLFKSIATLISSSDSSTPLPKNAKNYLMRA